jgi:thiol-disulfide isomerase/thioredoxin
MTTFSRRTSRNLTRLAASAALLAAPLTAGAVFAADASLSQPSVPGSGAPLIFQKSFDFQLSIAGALDDGAAFYRTTSLPGVLIVSSKLGGAYFTRAADRQVVPVNPLKMTVREEVILLESSGACGNPVAAWVTDKSDAAFTLGGKAVRVQPAPILDGTFTMDQVIQKTPSYQVSMSKYLPDAQAVEFLRNYKGTVDIEAYFGSWCHVCKQFLPQFLRTMKDCSNPNLHVQMFGLSREFGTDKRLRDEKQITGVPCIIIYKNGQEIGRISGPPQQSYEKDLGAFLRLAAARG